MTSSEALLFVERNIDTEVLIIEVQSRPALWDMTQKDYSDLNKKRQCWDEVTEVFGSSPTVEDKKKLGDVLQKKWRNIRDWVVKDNQDRKGKSGDGVRKKAPNIYAKHLEFLRDTTTPKKTVSSLERTSAKPTAVEEEREDDDVEEDEATSASSICSPAPNVSQAPRVGKKRLHPVEEQILRSLDNFEKRAKLDKAKENVEDNDNRHFFLSLVQSLTSLPRHLNTSCRIEIMQCINKFESMSQQHQQPLTYLPTTHSNPGYLPYNPQHQHQPQQQPHPLQQTYHRQLYVPNQLQSTSPSNTSNQLQSEFQQYPPRTFVTPMPTPSPAESTASYISNLPDEIDSQLNN